MENNLLLRKVGDITGDFYIEGYQRGYRWGMEEVKCLLDDVYAEAKKESGKKAYCLQPIVVKRRADNKFELIDGQQRLTTVYLIYKYISSVAGDLFEMPKITIEYATRERSAEFLRELDFSRSEEYIDFSYMTKAYRAIEQWFADESGGRKNDRTNIMYRINDAFCNFVQVIWYEVDESENSEKLFSRLNIGKIPLTCAELVKAMFLSDCGRRDERAAKQQDEIALQWDMTERQLHDDALWYFLTNKSETQSSTRIELVLDLMAGKPSDSREKYHTFFYFDGLRKSDLGKIWSEINRTFLLLKGWYDDDELYHKIGYLIASEHASLSELYALSRGRTKTEFKRALDGEIRASVNAQKNYGEMSYENANDRDAVSRLLLLFNVVSVFKLGDGNRFPFDRFKNTGGAKWSLEHIHAQNSKGLKTVEQWQAWIKYHIDSVRAVAPDAERLIERMTAAIDNKHLGDPEFAEIYDEAMALLSRGAPVYDKHRISNLALLDTGNNAALGNSAFDAKRRKIIAMDRTGKYIPFCTKMVFFKYYSPDAEDMYFWNESDRKNYVAALNAALGDYLDEHIEIVSEDD